MTDREKELIKFIDEYREHRDMDKFLSNLTDDEVRNLYMSLIIAKRELDTAKYEYLFNRNSYINNLNKSYENKWKTIIENMK